MATNDEKNNELSDAQLEQLLKLAYDAPEPSQDFVDALTQKLDREFSVVGSNELTTDASSPHLNNGATQTIEHSSVANPQRLATASRRHPWIKATVTLVLAASLLMALSLWNEPSAYGWASMLRAFRTMQLGQCCFYNTRIRYLGFSITRSCGRKDQESSCLSK